MPKGGTLDRDSLICLTFVSGIFKEKLQFHLFTLIYDIMYLETVLRRRRVRDGSCASTQRL